MSTVVAGEIATDQFALAETFDRFPRLSVEAERAVDHGDSVAMPLIWVDADRPRTVTRCLKADSTTKEVTMVASVEEKQLYRVTWSDTVRDVLAGILTADGSLLKVSADCNRWRFQVFYPDRCETSMSNGHGVRFDVNRVGPLETESAIKYGLTDKQHEALRIGWDKGYFNVPRKIGIEELSSYLGITHQSASERLRRGQSTLIEEAFGLQRS